MSFILWYVALPSSFLHEHESRSNMSASGIDYCLQGNDSVEAKQSVVRTHGVVYRLVADHVVCFVLCVDVHLYGLCGGSSHQVGTQESGRYCSSPGPRDGGGPIDSITTPSFLLMQKSYFVL